MNLLKRTAVSRAGFLLVLISLTGCATYVPDPPAADAHPEKYRQVYLEVPKLDPRSVSPRIASRLKEAGFHVTEVRYDPPRREKLSDEIKKVAELAKSQGAQEPAVVCSFTCISLYDQMDWRQLGFENIDIEFHDAETGRMIFRTFKNHFERPVLEDAELDYRFVEIANAFFPGQPNPFTEKK
jgi:hypothetical protein